MSDPNTNRPVFDLFVRFINSGEEDLASEVIATNAVFHAPGSDEPLRGPEGWLRVLRPMRASFPDIQWEVLETVEEGDTIAARFTTTGTHRGEFMGITPTGTSVSFTAMNFYRFADGKIIGEVGQPDLVSLLGQLGQSPLQTPF
jgi:steroid delta-isomerase-like uncharacterized protein